MLFHHRFPLLAIVTVLLMSCAGPAPSTNVPPTNSALVNIYDPKRDPAHDVQLAMSDAQRTEKRILLEVGGDWCIWCHHMDDFFEAHLDLRELRDQHYILVKVNYSPENENTVFLSHYPTIPGYPHLFVLDADGKLVHSQDTSALEEGNSYNLQKFTAFLQKWATS
jgi:thioredoxin-related protein